MALILGFWMLDIPMFFRESYLWVELFLYALVRSRAESLLEHFALLGSSIESSSSDLDLFLLMSPLVSLVAEASI